jgi:hypothetical protein
MLLTSCKHAYLGKVPKTRWYNQIKSGFKSARWSPKITIMKVSNSTEITQDTYSFANECTKNVSQWVTKFKSMYFLLQLSSTLEQCWHPRNKITQSYCSLSNFYYEPWEKLRCEFHTSFWSEWDSSYIRLLNILAYYSLIFHGCS